VEQCFGAYKSCRRPKSSHRSYGGLRRGIAEFHCIAAQHIQQWPYELIYIFYGLNSSTSILICMWNGVCVPASHVAGRNRHFAPMEAFSAEVSHAFYQFILIFMLLQYSNIKLELWRISRIVAHRFSTSARDSGYQTSLYIEICMRIDALKLNGYVYYGVENWWARFAFSIFDFRFSICRVVVSVIAFDWLVIFIREVRCDDCTSFEIPFCCTKARPGHASKFTIKLFS